MYLALACQCSTHALQEVELKLLRWLHEEEATGVQYLEVHPPHSAGIGVGWGRVRSQYGVGGEDGQGVGARWARGGGSGRAWGGWVAIAFIAPLCQYHLLVFMFMPCMHIPSRDYPGLAELFQFHWVVLGSMLIKVVKPELHQLQYYICIKPALTDAADTGKIWHVWQGIHAAAQSQRV